MQVTTNTPRIALCPNVESNIKAEIGDLLKLPTFAQATIDLKAQIEVEHPHDIDIALPNLSMDVDAFVLYDGNTFKYTRHALNQLVSRIRPEGVVGMGGYLAACPPDLRSMNYNYWHLEKFYAEPTDLKQNRAVLRVREDDNNSRMIRGVVSTSYVPIDDLPLMTRLGLILPHGTRLRFVRGDLLSRFTIIWPNQNGDIAVNDPVQFAIHMANSETGMSSVKMEPMIYVAAFGGSMLIPSYNDDVMIRHVGEAQTKLAKAVAKTLDAATPFIKALGDAYDDDISSITKDIDTLFTAIGKAFDLPAVKVQRAKEEFAAMNGTSRATVAGAFSRAANALDVESGEQMQRVAGSIVSNGLGNIKNALQQ